MDTRTDDQSGRFCEHWEDINEECDMRLIMIEQLFPSTYFNFCSDMPRVPMHFRRHRKLFTTPFGPRQRHPWYPKPIG